MIQIKDKIIAFLIYMIGIIGLSLPPLNVVFTYLISKRYKHKSNFLYKHAIDAVNINFSFIIHSIVLMILFAVFGMFFRHNGVSIDSITTNIAVIYAIFYYFLQILIAMISALCGKPSNLKIWPVLFET